MVRECLDELHAAIQYFTGAIFVGQISSTVIRIRARILCLECLFWRYNYYTNVYVIIITHHGNLQFARSLVLKMNFNFEQVNM